MLKVLENGRHQVYQDIEQSLAGKMRAIVSPLVHELIKVTVNAGNEK